MRTLDRPSVEMVCPGSNSADRLTLTGRRPAVPRPTPSCASESLVYMDSSPSAFSRTACRRRRLFVRVVVKPAAQQFFTESLILAQDERWRRA